MPGATAPLSNDGHVVFRGAGNNCRRPALAHERVQASSVRSDAPQRGSGDGILPHTAKPRHRARRGRRDLAARVDSMTVKKGTGRRANILVSLNCGDWHVASDSERSHWIAE